VSVQIVDPDGGWLLQRRAASKAAFADGWANSCCTHPTPGEDPISAARRRVGQELGLSIGRLLPAGSFTYWACDERSGLVEHEHDHVFVAVTDCRGAAPNPTEIRELETLSYRQALEVVDSGNGTPWAGQVLRLAHAALYSPDGMPGQPCHSDPDDAVEYSQGTGSTGPSD
jgi:isopentenyl-diphosphate delta-isomerase